MAKTEKIEDGVYKQSGCINEAFHLDGFDSHENIPPDYATATHLDKRQEHLESSVCITWHCRVKWK